MAQNAALKGLKVLDFSRVYAGPYCTMLLGDFGADVIKIENRKGGDDTRAFYPIKNGESGYFNYLNRSKRSVSLNLKDPKGREIALALAKEADVVVENFSPGAMARLGLAYEDIKKVNPQIIYASISGFGQQGPYSKKAAYDGVTQCMGGLASLTGLPDGVPMKAGPAISDAATGVHAAFGIMTAVYHKMQTGEGQHLDIALMDTVFSILENSVSVYTMMGLPPARIGNANPSSAPYNMYKTKDSHIIIATANDSLWARLCKLMGREELISAEGFDTNPTRKLNEKAVDAAVTEWTTKYTTEELLPMLDEVGIPNGPILTIPELVGSEHIKQREMLVTHHTEANGDIQYPGNPVKLSATPPDPSHPAPLLGQHNNEILGGILGMSDEEIAKLKADEVI